MAEPEIIQRQREILRAFRDANLQRSKKEEDIAARLKEDGEFARVELTQWKHQMDEIYVHITKTFDDAQTTVNRVGPSLTAGKDNSIVLGDDFETNANSVERLEKYMEFVDKTATDIKKYMQGDG